MKAIPIWALVVAFGCGGSGDDGVRLPSTHEVSMTSAFAFSPKVLIVRPADVVVWTNDSGMMHDVTPDPGAPVTMESDASFPAGMMNGDRFRWTVPLNLARGTYFYHCDFHGSAGSGSGFGGGMVGAITVK